MLCLALALSLLPTQQVQTLYQQVITKPDINNGYEDYLRAADIVTPSSRLDVYLFWTPKLYSQTLEEKRYRLDPESNPRWTEQDEVRFQMVSKLKELDHLSIQRLILKQYGDAFDQVRLGNQKRTWDPREGVDANTSFPEYAGFKNVLRMYAAAARVKLADGDSTGATKELLEGLTFARRIGGTTITSDLVSMIGNAIVFSVFNDELSRLTERDAEMIIKHVDAALSETPTLAQAVRKQRQFLESTVDLYLQAKPSEPYHLAEDEVTNGLAAYLREMPPSERETVKATVLAKLNEVYDNLETKLRGEESRWADPGVQKLPTNPEFVSNSKQCSDAVINEMALVLSQTPEAAMMRRAQLRILGLHARIIAFRWRTTHLPATLSEVASAAQRYDPIARTDFQYELNDGSYKLCSRGFESTGPIELRFKRQTNQPGNYPIPPLLSWRPK
jgi:hypothetical protein